MELPVCSVKERFKITGMGIIMLLHHSCNGLPKGTVLTSKISGLTWEVQARLLYGNMANEHVIFECEAVQTTFLRFSSAENAEKSRQRILTAERERVFDYMTQPIDHQEKPSMGEELILHLP